MVTKLEIEYTALDVETLAKIFELANLLEVTPKEACELYLRQHAAIETNEKDKPS